MNTNNRMYTDQPPNEVDEYDYAALAQMHMDHDRIERAKVCALLAQAHELRRIASAFEKIEEPIANNMGDLEAHVHLICRAIELLVGKRGIIYTSDANKV